MKRLGVKDLLYPDMRVRALCDRENIPVITLAPAMAKYAQSHKVFLHGFPNATMGFGHWNQAGNELAGKLIAARLCRPVAADRAAAATQPLSGGYFVFAYLSNCSAMPLVWKSPGWMITR